MAVPNTFVNGTEANADEVNANFDYITAITDKAVLDVSSNVTMSASKTGNFGTPTTGTAANVYDKDFTTSYDVSVASTGDGTKALITTADFGAIYYNAQLTYKIYINHPSIASANISVDYSTDGSNWTALKTGYLNNTAITYTEVIALVGIRYLRAVCTSDAHPVTDSMKFYELILTGVN